MLCYRSVGSINVTDEKVMNSIIGELLNREEKELRRFGDLSRGEKEDFILSVTALKVDTEERSR